jgi:hypothetical protein
MMDSLVEYYAVLKIRSEHLPEGEGSAELMVEIQ